MVECSGRFGKNEPTDEGGDVVADRRGSRQVSIAIETKLPAPSPTSRLPVLASAFIDAGQMLGVCANNKKEIVEAALGVAVSNGHDVRAVSCVVRETLYLVERATQQERSSCAEDTVESEVDLLRGKELGQGYSYQGGRAEAIPETLPSERARGVGCRASSVAYFLSLLAELWASLYAVSPECQRHLVRSLQDGLPTTSTETGSFVDVIHLATLAVRTGSWDAKSYKSEQVAAQQPRGTHLSGCLGRKWGALVEELTSIPLHAEHLPWYPAVAMMLWGAVSPVRAENALLSCMRKDKGKHGPASREKHSVDNIGQEKPAQLTSRDPLVYVVDAVVKGYHSLAIREDMSQVPMSDLLECVADSLTRIPRSTSACSHYHPMDLSRVIGRLAAM